MGNKASSNSYATDCMDYLIVGYSCSGKTTLINKIIGKDHLPNTYVTKYSVKITNSDDEKITNNDPTSSNISVKIPIFGDNLLASLYDTVGFENTSIDEEIMDQINDKKRFYKCIIFVINFRDIGKEAVMKKIQDVDPNYVVITHIDQWREEGFDSDHQIKIKFINACLNKNYSINNIFPVNLLNNDGVESLKMILKFGSLAVYLNYKHNAIINFKKKYALFFDNYLLPENDVRTKKEICIPSIPSNQLKLIYSEHNNPLIARKIVGGIGLGLLAVSTGTIAIILTIFAPEIGVPMIIGIGAKTIDSSIDLDRTTVLKNTTKVNDLYMFKCSDNIKTLVIPQKDVMYFGELKTTNNKVLYAGMWRNFRYHGKGKFYHTNGNIHIIAEFIDGTIDSSSFIKIYDENNNLTFSGYMYDNKLCGELKVYYDECYRCTFKNI
jgi:hypothetical protein